MILLWNVPYFIPTMSMSDIDNAQEWMSQKVAAHLIQNVSSQEAVSLQYIDLVVVTMQHVHRHHLCLLIEPAEHCNVEVTWLDKEIYCTYFIWPYII